MESRRTNAGAPAADHSPSPWWRGRGCWCARLHPAQILQTWGLSIPAMDNVLLSWMTGRQRRQTFGSITTVVHVSGVDEAVQVDMDVVAGQLHVVLAAPVFQVAIRDRGVC